MPIEPGQTVGQYVIRRKLGEGGMGIVYQAEQPAIGRPVALKVLAASVASDPGILERFKREVDIIAQLEHPHILPVYDYGEHEGNPFIVMRYMGGGSLLEKLRARSLPTAALLDVLGQVATALDYAHARGIVHRDLKPANVLLDDSGNACLADFGLAKTLAGTRDLTRTGSLLGTPAYMSPEQARGEKLDSRSDVYAFAVMAYLALSGQLPFHANSAMEYIQKHLTEAPAPLLTVAPHLPPGVDAVLRQALAKDRSLRPASCGELMQQLRAALAGAADRRQTTDDRAGALTAAGLPSPGTGTAVRGASAPATRAGATRAGQQGAGTMLAPGAAGVSPQPAPPPAAAARRRASPMLLALLLGLGGLAAVAALALAGLWLMATRGRGTALRAETYPVGDSPRALLYAAGELWVTEFFANTLTRLGSDCGEGSTTCGQPTGAVGVDNLPVGLASDGEHLWIASALGLSLTRLSAEGEPQATFPLPHVPSALLWDGSSLWIANAYSNTVTHVGADGRVLGDYAVGRAPGARAQAGQTLWVAHQDDDSVGEIDPASGALARTVPLAGRPAALAFDGERLWVALSDVGQVVAVAPESGEVLTRVTVGGQPTALLWNGERLWVADQTGNAVNELHPVTQKVTRTVAVGEGPLALAWVPCGAGCGDLWVANEAADSVSRVRVSASP